MTLEDAAEILNRESHDGWDTWFVMGGEIFGDGQRFAPDEAIALAEKYEALAARRLVGSIEAENVTIAGTINYDGDFRM